MIRTVIQSVKYLLCSLIFAAGAASADGGGAGLFAEAILYQRDVDAAITAYNQARKPEEARAALLALAKANEALQRAMREIAYDLSIVLPNEPKPERSIECSPTFGDLSTQGCICDGEVSCLVLRGWCAMTNNTYEGGTHVGRCSRTNF